MQRAGYLTEIAGVSVTEIAELIRRLTDSDSRFVFTDYAVGDDPDAADLSGVPVTRMLIQVYVISGIVCALAGWVLEGTPGWDQARIDAAQRVAQAMHTSQTFLKRHRALHARAHHVEARIAVLPVFRGALDVRPATRQAIETNAVGANGRATIMLRTEQIAVTAIDKAQATNGPTGRVLSQSFQGARCRLVVESMWHPDESGGGRNLTVETSSLAAPKVGAVVRLDIIGAAHVLARKD